MRAILDAVIDYLPAPKIELANSKEPLIFVFKTLVDKIHG